MTDVESRIARLETKILDIEENNVKLWAAHDAHAGEFRREIKEVMEKILNRLTDLPCKGHIEKFDFFQTSINLLWTVVIGVIFGGIVFGIWMHAVVGGV